MRFGKIMATLASRERQQRDYTPAREAEQSGTGKKRKGADREGRNEYIHLQLRGKISLKFSISMLQ